MQLLLTCGLVGSGKSTFSTALALRLPNWVRCNQDELRSKSKLKMAIAAALDQGQNVVIDRTHVTKIARQEWAVFAKGWSDVELAVLVFDTSLATCAARLSHRTGHPTLKDPTQALRVLHTMRRQWEEVSEDSLMAYVQESDQKLDYDAEDCQAILHKLSRSGKQTSLFTKDYRHAKVPRLHTKPDQESITTYITHIAKRNRSLPNTEFVDLAS